MTQQTVYRAGMVNGAMSRNSEMLLLEQELASCKCALTRWCNAMVKVCYGAMVQWCKCAMVQWCNGVSVCLPGCSIVERPSEAGLGAVGGSQSTAHRFSEKLDGVVCSIFFDILLCLLLGQIH